MKVCFFIRGTSIPKARPRVSSGFSKRGKRWSFTPRTTETWERTVAAEFKAQCRAVFFTKDEPLKLYIEIVMPGSGPRATIRGDWENHAKSLCDALNTVAWHDDAQIVDAHVIKRRAGKSELAGVHVEIESLAEVSLFDKQQDVMRMEKTA